MFSIISFFVKLQLIYIYIYIYADEQKTPTYICVGVFCSGERVLCTRKLKGF